MQSSTSLRRLFLAAIIFLVSFGAACSSSDDGSNPPDNSEDVSEKETSTGETVSDAGGDTDPSDTSQDTEPSPPDDAVSDARDETDEETTTPEPLAVSYDFTAPEEDNVEAASEGWEAGISDYAPNQEELTDFKSRVTKTPLADDDDTSEFDAIDYGYYIESTNVADNNFMFLKRKVGSELDLEPNQTYKLHWNISLLSNAGSGCAGIGGGPGSSVHLKAGGSTEEPEVYLDEGEEHSRYKIDIDKSNQSTGGRNAGVAGDVANGSNNCNEGAPYKKIQRDYTHEYPIMTDDDGNMWVIVGTDSGFEGPTGLYYVDLKIEFEKTPPRSCGADAGKCNDDEYCDYPSNSCGDNEQSGRCDPKPIRCTGNRDPVCGCDGQTYETACKAHINGVDIASEGECSDT